VLVVGLAAVPSLNRVSAQEQWMKKRLQAVKRMLVVQQQLRKKAEARLAELQRQEFSLMEQERELVQFLNGDLMPSGAFAASVSRRFRSLAARIALVHHAKEAQKRQLLEQLQRLKRAERVADRLSRDNRVVEERKSLADLIESAVGRDSASLG
jgi:hypothetical protein